jgi:hypothetical protein
MRNRKLKIGDKKARDALPKRSVREKVNKDKNLIDISNALDIKCSYDIGGVKFSGIG